MKDNTDLIEAYLNNELLGDELLNFEKELVINNELASEVKLHQQFRSFIKENEVENLKSHVKNWLYEEANSEELIPEIKLDSQKSKSIFSISLITKIAAGLAIFFGLAWYFFLNNNTKSLESQYLSELTNQNPSQLQGADDRAQWVQAYREKNYKKVITFLQSKKNISPEENYYLGLAYSAENQNDKALKTFSIKAVQESVFAEKAEWATALIYLKLYKKAEAIQLLKKIENSDSQFRYLSQKIEL